jgi:hypothetical protein
MQDTIEQILDLTTKFLTEEYNFLEVNPSLHFFKADDYYKSIGGNDYRDTQVSFMGSFERDGVTYDIPQTLILNCAEATYTEAIARLLNELENPGASLRWTVERLIIQPCINKAKEAELV